ncbi:MAG: hypothetical protein ABSG43_00315 [Solirubrobacteraceae bacterium]|jgi:hypothetical protein
MSATLSRSARKSRRLLLPIMMSLGASSLLAAGPAAADTYGLKVAPASLSAITGQAMNVTVSAMDTSTNKVLTTYTGTVGLTSAVAGGTGPVDTDVLPASYTFKAADKGVHVFPVTLTDSTTDGSATTDTITATDSLGAPMTAGTAAIVVANGVPTHLSIVAPTTDVAGTASATAFTVNAVNAYNKLVTSDVDSVQLSSSDSAASMPAAANLVAGAHTFTAASTKLDTVGSQTITTTVTGTNPLTSSTPITVTLGPATVLAISAPPVATNGQTIPVTVTALDAGGNVATGYTGTVKLTDPKGQTLTYPYTKTDKGIHVFNDTLNAAGADTLKAGDGTILNTAATNQLPIQVAAGNVTHLGIAPTTYGVAGTTQVAGTAVNYNVTALNAYNQPVAVWTDNVEFSSTDPLGSATNNDGGDTNVFSTKLAVGPLTTPGTNDTGLVFDASYTFDTDADAGGVHEISVLLNTPGVQTITVQDTGNPAIVGTDKVTVTAPAAGAASLVVTTPNETAINGQTIPVTVTAIDANGLIVPSYTGTVALTSAAAGGTGPVDSDVLPASYTFTSKDNGVHVFNVTVKDPTTDGTATVDTITATDANGKTGAAAVNVDAGSVTHFSIISPAPVTTKSAASFTVNELNAYNQLVTGAGTDTAAVTTSGLSTVTSSPVTFAATGSAAFTVKWVTPGAQTITAKATTAGGNTALVGSLKVTLAS